MREKAWVSRKSTCWRARVSPLGCGTPSEQEVASDSTESTLLVFSEGKTEDQKQDYELGELSYCD